MMSSSRLAELQVLRRAKPRAFRSRKCSESRLLEVENHGTATKNIARQPGSRPRKKQARAGGTEPGPPAKTERKGSLHGVVRVLHAAPRPAANAWVFEPALLSQKVTNAPINPNLDPSSETDLETRGKYRELKRKLSERALTQRKARAREEPPASETDAGPPGHQPRGGAAARPRQGPT